MNNAISLHREALALRPTLHPDRSMSLNNLANLLEVRFEQTGKMADMNEAIFLHREALALVTSPHPHRSGSLCNLASALHVRFRQSGEVDDLDEAISLLRELLTLLPPPHLHRAVALSNLANVLHTRFGLTGEIEEMNEAISMHREALKLLPPPHPDRPELLNNLASVLYKRFSDNGNIEDKDEAVELWRNAIQLLPLEHPDICTYSFNLGFAFSQMYSRTEMDAYQEDAVACFRAAVACQSAPASQRFRAAEVWAYNTDAKHDSALEAYRSAIHFLPRLVNLGLDLPSRQQMLFSLNDKLAQDAAACAIRSGLFDQAVELLENGRGIFWSQALQLRTPLDELHRIAPELAERFQHVSYALEHGSFRSVPIDLSDEQKQISLEQESNHFHRLNKEWLAIIEEIRRIDGFQDFLRPKSFVTLKLAASNGPIVILNASASGCDALIVTRSGISHITLTDITYEVAKVLAQLVQSAISSAANIPLPDVIHNLLQQMSSDPDVPYTYSLTERRGRLVPYIPVKRHIKPSGMPLRDPSQMLENLWRPWSYGQVFTGDHETVFRGVLAKIWTSIVEPVIGALQFEVIHYLKFKFQILTSMV